MPLRSPVRDAAIEFLLRNKAGLTTRETAAAVAAIVTSSGVGAAPSLGGDAAGASAGDGSIDVVVREIHGEEVTPAALTGDVDDYAPGDALIWRLDLAGNTITGFAAPTTPGEVHLVVALTGGTLSHDDSASAAENRLLVTGGASLAMGDDDMALIVYDGESSRWRVLGDRSGSGGGLTPGSYTLSNDTTDRTFNADATTIDELADVVATLIRDLGGA